MAFVNARLLRAPLARILGLIEIIEIENNPIIDNNKIEKIRVSASHADYVIRHINQVISSN